MTSHIDADRRSSPHPPIHKRLRRAGVLIRPQRYPRQEPHMRGYHRARVGPKHMRNGRELRIEHADPDPAQLPGIQRIRHSREIHQLTS